MTTIVDRAIQSNLRYRTLQDIQHPDLGVIPKDTELLFVFNFGKEACYLNSDEELVILPNDPQILTSLHLISVSEETTKNAYSEETTKNAYI